MLNQVFQRRPLNRPVVFPAKMEQLSGLNYYPWNVQPTETDFLSTTSIKSIKENNSKETDFPITLISCEISQQVIQRRPYGKPVDVWSTGILLHILLSGTMPFLGTKDRLYEAVCAGKLYLSGSRWQSVSEQVIFCPLSTVCLFHCLPAAKPSRSMDHSQSLEFGAADVVLIVHSMSLRRQFYLMTLDAPNQNNIHCSKF